MDLDFDGDSAAMAGPGLIWMVVDNDGGADCITMVI